jgi:hypothetical protein
MYKYIISLILLLTITSTSLCADSFPTTFKYTAIKSDQKKFNITFSYIPTVFFDVPCTHILTHASGNMIQETNNTFITSKNTVIAISQTTSNNYDNAYYDWYVDNIKPPAQFTMINKKKHSSQLSNKLFPNNALSLQAFIYLLPKLNLTPKSVYYFDLLVPPDKFYSMYADIIDTEIISCPIGHIECYKIRIGLEGFFGALLPKHFFWISKNEPYNLIQFVDQNFTYILSSVNTHSTVIHKDIK